MWPDESDELTAAFPGYQRQQQNPWSPPPSWTQPFPPPPWANAQQGFQTHSPARSWNAPSPFSGAQMELGPWDSGWSSPSIPTRPMESSFGQPLTPGFFGANTNHDNWNGIVRSTSERANQPYSAASPWWSPSAQPTWDLPRPRSAGPTPYAPPSPNRTGTPAYLIPDTWDETNLARRPRDWRASYNPRTTFLSSLSVLPSVLKNQSDVQEYTDPQKRRLSSLLGYHLTHPPVQHDLRLDPRDHSNPVLHARMSTNDHRRPFTELDMAQFATEPPASFLRLFHPKLPWYIDIRQTRPDGVTVSDVLSQLCALLAQQILPRHYWNDVLSEKDRADIAKAYRRRTNLLRSGNERGILWVDYLCGDVIFEGLAKAKGGIWEIKTRNAYQ
ncbi:hypothetical protein AN958_01885 [Leucoagaricus sp. SymC.cos]|nr:hypothetical protein AN958_01885 [Leucoagaricus sp. SymC.cos]